MARVFDENGVAAIAISGDTNEIDRNRALANLSKGDVHVVFSVDLFNEGVDLPEVDALLMLRPTDSPVLFLQQLGRGLRKSPGKSTCTVLDFVGQHRKEFRYDRRFQALLGGSRSFVMRQIEDGFPFLPAGCHMELDRVASERVLQSIRSAVPSNWPQKVAELKKIRAESPNVSLRTFLETTGLELEEVYSGNKSWSDLKQEAGLEVQRAGPHEKELRRACGRLLHVDDAVRLQFWRAALPEDSAPLSWGEYDRRLLTMLLSQVLDQVAAKDMSLSDGIALFWRHPQVRAELAELFEALSHRIAHLPNPIESLSNVPLQHPARYTRHEILAACGVTTGVRTRPWREGVHFSETLPGDLCVFTLDKTNGQFSPTTRYRDFAISRELIHWESQSMIGPASNTGQRYQKHVSLGSHILLFARLRNDDRAFYFLGPATYVSHEGAFPMAVTWRLHHPLPGDLFAAFSAAVA
jgi:hypothetical protein